MGEVYRARDTKLGREVALKILPETVAQDGDRIARFKREAQVLAALNHPHIAAIYGFEDAGATHFLVLELAEGETLADRLKRGPIPVDDAIAIARQIAEALEEAHEKGIVHRDLKPANVALSGNDQVKVLDFGLAKLAAPPGGGASSSVSMSPTLTTPAMMTGVGMILGTAAYMAPEQAKGREADKRSDLWAFGCVVYEMLTAKRAFEGEDVTDTIAAIMRGEPDWTALPAQTPANVRTLLQGCLAKDRRQRLADVRCRALSAERSVRTRDAPRSRCDGAAAALAARAFSCGRRDRRCSDRGGGRLESQTVTRRSAARDAVPHRARRGPGVFRHAQPADRHLARRRARRLRREQSVVPQGDVGSGSESDPRDRGYGCHSHSGLLARRPIDRLLGVRRHAQTHCHQRRCRRHHLQG